MASRWSSDFNVAEHKDLQATAMAMDRNGNFILLAGKRHITLKNLNDPSDSLKKFPKNNKYDVVTAEWNPSAFNEHLCSVAAHQKIEIFSWSKGNLILNHALKCHTRSICDINWHKFNPNLLASASLDSFTHIWDIRDPRKPSMSYSAIGSAHHVRWNKLSTYLLATAHDRDIRIWDQRKGSAPIQYISAHSAKVHGLDWSQTHEYQLASCSQDGTVKFFDVTHPKCAESLMQTASPVWRARYTPFGEGLVTVVISVSPKNENGLLLWNLSNQSMPVHTFVGHTDVVLEFDWRRSREVSEYQLVTWSKDQSLRIWRIEPFLQKLCGYDAEIESMGVVQDLNREMVSDASNEDLLTARPEDLSCSQRVIPAVEAVNEISFSNFDYFQNPEKYSFSPQDPSKSLELEFSILSSNTNLSNVKFDEMNISDRICIVTVSANSLSLTLQINFPLSYPTNAAPSFQIDEASSIDDLLRTKILKVLKQTAQQRVKKNRICLESCLRQLIVTLEHSVQLQEIEAKPDSRMPVPGKGEPSTLPIRPYFYETLSEIHVPFPKTCGARFCSVDKLVCFYRPAIPRSKANGAVSFTPRSFASVAGTMGLPSVSRPAMFVLANPRQNVSEGSVSYFVQERSLNRQRNGNFQMNKLLKNVTIYDCSKLFLASKDLGMRYSIDCQNVGRMCDRNAEAAAGSGRSDLVQVWNLAGLVAAASALGNEIEEGQAFWSNHPFFEAQIEGLILHYAKISDIQTAAMLSCIFASAGQAKGPNLSKYTGNKSVTPGGSPYHTIHPADTSLEGWNYPAPKHSRSNSWSESVENLKAIATILEHKETTETGPEKNTTKPLAGKSYFVYDEFKRKYADVLHRWNLLEARTQIIKFVHVAKDSSGAMEFLFECQKCKKQISKPPYCSFCKSIALRCAVCRILVRGSSNFCFLCGHGGHTKHIMAWFRVESICPTGCGCRCMSDLANMLEI